MTFAASVNQAHTVIITDSDLEIRRRWQRDQPRSRLQKLEPGVMPLKFQPPSPPCVKCGITTVIAPAFKGGHRVFVVRCPARKHAATYSLDNDTLRAW